MMQEEKRDKKGREEEEKGERRGDKEELRVEREERGSELLSKILSDCTGCLKISLGMFQKSSSFEFSKSLNFN